MSGELGIVDAPVSRLWEGTLKHTKRTEMLFFALLCALLVAACQKKAEPVPVLRIGYALHDHHAPLFIAAKNPDYFKEHGGVYLRELDAKKTYEMMRGEVVLARLELMDSTGGGELIRKLSEDQFDLVFGGVPAMLQFIDEGSRLQILAPSNADGAGLVVGTDLPAQNWQEFVSYLNKSDRPVRIGYKIAVSVQNLIFEQALKSEGISYGSDLTDKTVKVHLVNLFGPKNLGPALKDGLIDGFVVNQPFAAKAEYENIGRMIAGLGDLPPAGMWKGSPCCAVAGSARIIETRPDVVETLVTLLLRANRFIQEQPGKAAADIAAWLDLPVRIEQLSLPTILYTYEFDDDWQRGIDFWVDTMIGSGSLKGGVKEAQGKGTLQSLLYAGPLYERARRNM